MNPSCFVPAQNSSVLLGDVYFLSPDWTILSEFGKLVKENGEKISIISDTAGSLTYRQVDEISDQVAGLLQNALPPEKAGNRQPLVAVCMDPSPKVVATLLGVIKCGCAYMPIDLKSPQHHLLHILKTSDPEVLVIDEKNEKLINYVKQLELETKILKYETVFDVTTNFKLPEKAAGSLECVLHTSGSTGLPKGVCITHHALSNRLKWQWEHCKITKLDVYVWKSALTFVDSMTEIFAALLGNVPLLIASNDERNDPIKLLNLLSKYRVTRLVLVPSLLQSLINLSKQGVGTKLKYLRYWICSGEALSLDLVREFFTVFPDHVLCNYYGCTEVMGDVTYVDITKESLESSGLKVSVGSPLFNTNIYVADSESETKIVKQGGIGEVYASGANIADGYLSIKSNNKFIENPFSDDPVHGTLYRTGDLGYVENGKLFLVGRTDAQIKVRGKKVQLSEIEDILRDLDQVKEPIVLCVGNGLLTQAVIAFVVLNYGSAVDLRQKLADILPDYMIPQIVVKETFPLLVNQKIDRQKLLTEYLQRSSEIRIDYSGIPEKLKGPAEILLKSVAKVVGYSADIGAISVDSNFYHIGGTSLNTFTLISELEDCGFRVSVSVILDAKNLYEIAEKLERNVNSIDVDRSGLFKNSEKFEFVELKNFEPEIGKKILVDCFRKKNDLSIGIPTDEFDKGFNEVTNQIYENAMVAGLSFGVRRKGQNEVIGVTINIDLLEEPKLSTDVGSVMAIFDFLEEIEAKETAKLKMSEKGFYLHSFLMGTGAHVSSAENVELVCYMEKVSIEIAKQRGFKAIFTDNVSKINQQVCEDLLGYKLLSKIKVCEYVNEKGVKPFPRISENVYACIDIKYL